jgi:glycerophosphoryl diester phosphodiesterase
VGLVTMTNPLPRGEGQLLGPAWPLLRANPAYVAAAHRQGKIVAPLDTTPEKRMAYYLWLGVDAVLADDPGRALAAMTQGMNQEALNQ